MQLVHAMTDHNDVEGLLTALQTCASDFFDTVTQMEDEADGSMTYRRISCVKGNSEIRIKIPVSNNGMYIEIYHNAEKKISIAGYVSNTVSGISHVLSAGGNVVLFLNASFAASYTPRYDIPIIISLTDDGAMQLTYQSNDGANITYTFGYNQATYKLCFYHCAQGATIYTVCANTNSENKIVASPVVGYYGISKNLYFSNMRPFASMQQPFEFTVGEKTYCTFAYNSFVIEDF